MVNLWDKILEAGKWVKGKWKYTILAILGIGVAYALVPQTLTSLEEQTIQEIEISQNAYFSQHGRYWQGLPTHTFIPDATTTLNNLSVKPFYQAEGWNDLVSLPDKLPFQVEVHQYKAPNNNYGYQILLRNDKEIKSIGYGIEAQQRTFEIKLPTLTATTT